VEEVQALMLGTERAEAQAVVQEDISRLQAGQAQSDKVMPVEIPTRV
jgi:hypothetical protein